MKVRLGLCGFLGLALGMAGCGGAETVRGNVASPPSSWDQSGGSGNSVASASASPSSVEGTAPPASPMPMSPPPPRSAEASSSPPALAQQEEERSPNERPGLGTEWGETLFSQVRETPFDRASEDPFALLSLHYDDRAGVAALAARHGSFAHVSNVLLGNGWVSMQVRGEGGRALDAFRQGDRTYVVGSAGERYTIVLTNRTSRRFEAVATVDGLDVMNGQPGSLSNRGYLLDPYANLTIDGFRQSDDAVAAFRFGRVGESYAAKTGRARDVGVIGVAFFSERGDRAREIEARYRDGATPFPADRYARPPR